MLFRKNSKNLICLFIYIYSLFFVQYSEPAVTTGDVNDQYMAGFLAGIKANKPNEQKDKEEKEKLEFEEKLKNGN